MLKNILLLCCLSITATEVVETEIVAESNTSACDKISTIAYLGTGTLGIVAALKLVLDKFDWNLPQVGKIVGASALAGWLIKESCCDVGYTWVALKQEVDEYKQDRDAFAEAVGVELSSPEKTLGEIAQVVYLIPHYYWREMVSLPSAAILLNYVYKVLSKQNRMLKISY
jgi:hypothetical protein